MGGNHEIQFPFPRFLPGAGKGAQLCAVPSADLPQYILSGSGCWKPHHAVIAAASDGKLCFCDGFSALKGHSAEAAVEQHIGLNLKINELISRMVNHGNRLHFF